MGQLSLLKAKCDITFQLRAYDIRGTITYVQGHGICDIENSDGTSL
jgi:hypothetical protein